MELHLRCLYHHDANDRIVRTRQPNGWPSPLFHLGRTRLANLWRFRDDLEPAAIRELARLAGREGPLLEAHPPPERMEAIRSVLRSAVELVVEWRGPAFRFPAEIPAPDRGPLPVVAVTAENQSILEESFADTVPELAERQPCIAAVDGERAVSMCYAARPLEVKGCEPCRGAEAGVETVAAYRGRGLAPRVVAAWGRAMREQGGEPMYSTSWDNKASCAVARKLGLVFYGEDLHLS
jgi:RimJ/RimL family protein N-acetyltransferase